MVLSTTFALAQRHEREMNITHKGNGHRKNCLDAQCHMERVVPLPRR